MKKMIFIVLICMLLTLYGCKKEQELICGTDEENINGVCEIILEPEELALVNALANTENMTNYQMDIIIQNGFELYDIIILFDDEKSSFEINLQKDYYEKQQGVLYRYIPQGDVYAKEIVEESESDTFSFFKEFDLSWFTFSADKYLLNIQNHANVQIFFEKSFPGSVLSNFEMTITNNYISSMDFFLRVGDINYHLVFQLTNIGTVDIVLPVV